jgi:hypothetical protein
VRFVTAQETAPRAISWRYRSDQMNNLAKVEEEQHKNRYLSYAEQKHKEKWREFSYTPLETTMMKKSLTETVLLSFTNLSMRKYFQKRCWQVSNWYQYCRLFTRKFQALL